jgi:hypothetical protein
VRAQRVEPDERDYDEHRDDRTERETGGGLDPHQLGEVPTERVGVHRHRPDVPEDERPAHHPRERRSPREALDERDRPARLVGQAVQPVERVAGARGDHSRNDEREPGERARGGGDHAEHGEDAAADHPPDRHRDGLGQPDLPVAHALPFDVEGFQPWSPHVTVERTGVADRSRS